MEWDQYIFKKATNLWRFFTKERVSEATLANTVTLDEVRPRLTALARLLCGFAVNIQAAAGVGGYKGEHFFLPEKYDHTDNRADNLNFYLFRVLYLYGQFKLQQYWQNADEYSEKQATAAAQDNAQAIIDYLNAEFEAFEALYGAVLENEKKYQQKNKAKSIVDLSFVYGKYYYVSQEEKQSLEALLNPVQKNTVAFDKEKEAYTELKSPSKEQSEVLKADTKAQEEYTLTHNFEKIETLDAFSGRWRDFDGSDQLEEHAEALQELDLRYLVRVDNPVHSIYKTEFVNSLGLIEANSIDSSQYHLSYPEWDEQKKQYRTDFCHVFPAFCDKTNNSEFVPKALTKNRVQVRQMQKHAERFLTDYFVKKRLEWGEEPDLDAMVEAYVDIHAGSSPSEKLYQSQRKRTKDVAVLVLADVSLSTDGYVKNKRILDTEKEALAMVGEVWDKLGLRFQMDTFSSRTHNHCYYQTIKAFHHTWAQRKDYLGAVESSGYTRIGTAIRHAAYLLSNVRADTRWLLLLTDGKPNDYDKYEGSYGIYDTKKAITEARQANIHVSAIAIDEKAKFYLPQMFGKGGFEILTHPDRLSFALLNGYLKILK